MGHVWPYTPCLRLLGRRCLSACCAAGWSPHGPTSGWLGGSYCQPCCCWCRCSLLPPHNGSAAAWAPRSQARRGNPSPWCTAAGGTGRGQRARSWQRRSFQHFSRLGLDCKTGGDAGCCANAAPQSPRHNLQREKCLMSFSPLCESIK